MITIAVFGVFGTVILWIFSFIPAFSSILSTEIEGSVSFFTRMVDYAWGWRNWIPLHLIAVCLGVIFSVWVATMLLSFFRVIYSMFFGGGGSK